jgi:hypothetical protein
MGKEARLPRRGIDAAQRAQLEAGLGEPLAIVALAARLEDARVALRLESGRRRLERHEPPARTQVTREPCYRLAQPALVEDVLEHGHDHDPRERAVERELGEVALEESGSATRVRARRRDARPLDHAAREVDARDVGAARGHRQAPATDAAADVEHAIARIDPQERRERAALRGLDVGVVEARHAERAHRGQTVLDPREALRALLPVRARKGGRPRSVARPGVVQRVLSHGRGRRRQSGPGRCGGPRCAG